MGFKVFFRNVFRRSRAIFLLDDVAVQESRALVAVLFATDEPPRFGASDHAAALTRLLLHFPPHSVPILPIGADRSLRFVAPIRLCPCSFGIVRLVHYNIGRVEAAKRLEARLHNNKKVLGFTLICHWTCSPLNEDKSTICILLAIMNESSFPDDQPPQ